MSASCAGFGPPGWGNAVSVTATVRYDPLTDGEAARVHRAQRQAGEGGDESDADCGGDRHLVRIEANYKSTRPGEYPVDLTRVDAACFVAAVLEAVEDTFPDSGVGGLRATDAAALLRALGGVDLALSQLRERALGDLLRGVGIEPVPGGAGGTGMRADRAAGRRREIEP